MTNKDKRPPLTPETTFCPNFDCPARGQTGKGNIRVHSQKERRYLCRECGQTFSARRGTAFYRLRKATDLIALVVALLAHGCPVRAIVAAFGLDERTVRKWLARSGQHAQLVHEHLVEQPLKLGQVQCDELRIKAQGAIIWMAMALMVSTRLWLGGEVSAQRNHELIARSLGRVKGCASALGGAILFCVDGLASYPTALLQVFREKEPRQQTGRCRLRLWPQLLIGQVIKQYQGHRVVGVRRYILRGTKEAVAALIKSTQGRGELNTAFIERLNATFRSSLYSLARRTRSLARHSGSLRCGMFLVGCVYNFCAEHESLRLPGLIGGHKWLGRTPAMATGLTDHCWSLSELLSFQVPPPRWVPQMPRGRPSNAFKAKIARWCQ